MTELIKTDLGTLSATGVGHPRVGIAGAHTATIRIVGAGAVSATVEIQGSNDGTTWSRVASAQPSGTGVAQSVVRWTDDYGFVRLNASDLSANAVVSAVVITDQGGGGASGGAGFTKNPTTGMFETTVGSEKALAFPADEDGVARGVYVGRSDTLAGLVALTANEGEVGVATNGAYLVKFGANAYGNVVFGNEIAVDVGNITYGNEASGFGWIVGDGGVPTFLVPTGIRRIVLISTRPDKGVHPDITVAAAFILRPTLVDLNQCPEISVTIAAKLDVGSCTAFGYGGGQIFLVSLSSTSYWPAVIKFVAAPALDIVGGVKLLSPTSVTAIAQGDAHALVS